MATSVNHTAGDRFLQLIARSPVIPAVRQPQHLPQSVAAPSSVVYLLCGSVMTIREMVEGLRAGGKAAVVNIDLLGGLAGDVPGVQFLELCGVSGVISTHAETLRAARARGLLAVQRSFLLDSHAVANSLRALERFTPDAVEMLPAPAAPRVVGAFAKAHPEVVLTAGGLITSLAVIRIPLLRPRPPRRARAMPSARSG
jgi:glycerol uptake operon antiterminator